MSFLLIHDKKLFCEFLFIGVPLYRYGISYIVLAPPTVNAPQTSYTPTVGQKVILQYMVTSGTASIS